MSRKLALLGMVTGLAIALPVVPASAAQQIFYLTTADPAAGLGAGPFGTVTVTENGGSLDFVETLYAGYKIHDGNSNHNAFAFSILGNPNVTVSNLTAGFSLVSGSSSTSVSAPPMGTFYTAIDCSSACGPGYAGGYAGPLSFTVSAGSALSLASLGSNMYNGQTIYFATDLVNAAGKTGNVGATMSAVPEPAAWGLMVLGFGAIGGFIRRGKKTRLALNYA